MRTSLTMLLAAAALALSACGSDESAGSADSAASATTPTTTATAAATTPESAGSDSCERVDAAAPKSGDTPKPTGKLDPNKTYLAVFKTSCGTITIKLDVKDNPKTANSFATLVKAGYFDGTSFHRVVKGWVVQGGDPSGNGTGGPKWRTVEAPPKDAKYERGVVAMAKTGTDPDGASGSQFFIVVAADAGLPPQYAIAGKVKTGRQAVDAISDLGTDGGDGPPSRPVVIEKATLKVK